jgi:hypothetical protein
MNDTRSADVPEPVLATLVALLDVVVLERLHGGAFRQLGGQPSPAWFVETFVGEEPGAPVTLVQAFPVLDAFLSEAEIFWERTGFGRLEGEAFVVTGPGGHNLPLSAVAVAMEGRRFLLIQRVAGFDDRQHILQRAREQALAHEQIVKQIHALRRPFAKLTDLTGQLALSGEPSEAQRALLSGIHAEIETLGQVLDGLPKLPPGVSARRG